MLGWLVSSVWKCVGMTVNADYPENSHVMFCHNKQRPLKKIKKIMPLDLVLEC